MELVQFPRLIPSPWMSGEYNFLKQTWYPDNTGDPIPDILVWGTSSSRECNNETGSYSPVSNVIAQVVYEPTDVSARRIVVSDRVGAGSPTQTGGIALPIKPFAYWTFDLHESLFDDGTSQCISLHPDGTDSPS